MAIDTAQLGMKEGSIPTLGARKPPARRGGGGRLAFGVVVVLLLGLGGYLAKDSVFAMFSSSGEGVAEYQTHTVSKGPLLVSVTEDGNVESASNVDVKCQIDGGSQILSIVPEGTTVKEGDELVRLDASAIEDQINQQTIAYERANSTFIQAEEEFAVAGIAVREYVEGTVKQELQVIEANIVIAKENLKSAENNLEYAEKMYRKGYINEDQVATNRFAVERAKLDQQQYQTSRKVLEEFTKEKMTMELESGRDAAAARMRAESKAKELEKSKLDQLTRQLSHTVIMAPQGGMVIYANEQSRRGGSQNPSIEEGAQVRAYQTIIQLPDLSQMQVKVTVHETKVNKMKQGMEADIKIREFDTTGYVETVATQPEPGSWFSSSVKEYATVVRLDDNHGISGLKPGMTAEVEIIIEQLEDVLTVPLLGILESNDKHFCYLATPTGYEKREVVIGSSNDKYIEVKDGLKVGDEVILNPRATIAEARKASEARDAEKKGRPKKDRKSSGKQGARKGGMPSPKSAPGKRAGGQGRPDLMASDANKDGKVSKEEAPARMKPFFSMMDANKDGFIDKKEIAALKKKYAGKRKQGGQKQKQARRPNPGAGE